MLKETNDESSEMVQRLCSEIQLFDLCDLDSCSYKAGRFCTNQDLLARFERISDDDRRPAVRFIPDEEPDEELEADYDDGPDADDRADGRDDWEDE